MSRALAIALFWTVAVGFPAVAGAGGRLASRPLPAGGGIECACMNLTNATVEVDFVVQAHAGGSFTCPEVAIPAGAVRRCAASSLNTWACTVALSNGGSASPKVLACTLTSLDADGAATAAVPVDLKLK